MLDDIPHLFYGCVERLPTFFEFTLEGDNGGLIFLAQLHCRLHLGNVADDFCVELATGGKQVLLVACQGVWWGMSHGGCTLISHRETCAARRTVFRTRCET